MLTFLPFFTFLVFAMCMYTYIRRGLLQRRTNDFSSFHVVTFYGSKSIPYLETEKKVSFYLICICNVLIQFSRQRRCLHYVKIHGSFLFTLYLFFLVQVLQLVILYSMPSSPESNKDYISLIVAWVSFYFRPLIKGFLRLTTRLCELQRICYGEATGGPRSIAVGM